MRGEDGADWRWERWILGGLFGLALLFRMWDLGLRPPTPLEAAQAWAAWHGGALPPGSSPLLAGWNATVFAIFGPDDGWMRSGAALAGALPVIALWVLLRPMGRMAAVGAAWLWALSPSALMASRFLDGGIVAAAALAAALAAWRVPHPSRWVWVAVASGVGAAAGPAFWTGCLMWLPLGWLDPPEPAFPRWRALALFGITALLVGAWGGWRGSGMMETVDGLSAWLAGFTLENLPFGWTNLFAFLRAEAPILLLGLAGGVWAVRRRDPFQIAATAGAGIGIGLRLARWGAPFTEHPVVLLPWIMLAGHALQQIGEAVGAGWRARWMEVGGGVGMGLIAIGTAALMGARADGEAARGLVLGAVLGLLGLGVWALSRGLETDEEARTSASGEPASPQASRERPLIAWIRTPVARGVGLALIVAVALAQIARAAGLARQADPLPGFSQPEMTSPAVREIVAFLREEAMRRKEWLGGLSLVVVAEEETEAFWRWTLRGFPMTIHRSPWAAGAATGDVWITPEGWPLPLPPEGWVGRAFPAFVDLRAGMGPVVHRMALWVRVPTVERPTTGASDLRKGQLFASPLRKRSGSLFSVL